MSENNVRSTHVRELALRLEFLCTKIDSQRFGENSAYAREGRALMWAIGKLSSDDDDPGSYLLNERAAHAVLAARTAWGKHLDVWSAQKVPG